MAIRQNHFVGSINVNRNMLSQKGSSSQSNWPTGRPNPWAAGRRPRAVAGPVPWASNGAAGGRPILCRPVNLKWALGQGPPACGAARVAAALQIQAGYWGEIARQINRGMLCPGIHRFSGDPVQTGGEGSIFVERTKRGVAPALYRPLLSSYSQDFLF